MPRSRMMGKEGCASSSGCPPRADGSTSGEIPQRPAVWQQARAGITDVPRGARELERRGVVQAEVIVAVAAAAGAHLAREVLRRERMTIGAVDAVRVHLVADHDVPLPEPLGGPELGQRPQ